jgi:hypothetical protein
MGNNFSPVECCSTSCGWWQRQQTDHAAKEVKVQPWKGDTPSLGSSWISKEIREGGMKDL